MNSADRPTRRTTPASPPPWSPYGLTRRRTVSLAGKRHRFGGAGDGHRTLTWIVRMRFPHGSPGACGPKVVRSASHDEQPPAPWIDGRDGGRQDPRRKRWRAVWHTANRMLISYEGVRRRDGEGPGAR